MPNDLQTFLTSKILTPLTQCHMCGQENAWKLDPYFNAYDGPCRMIIYCTNCFTEVFLDAYRLRKQLGISRDTMNDQFYEIVGDAERQA